MHKWITSIVLNDGQRFDGRAKLVSEQIVSVRVQEVLKVNTPCKVHLKLPETPGGLALREVGISCLVNQVIFGSNAIHLKLHVRTPPVDGLQVFLANCPKT
jgi:hypothetical protein